jgi:hypothetical protein
MGNRCSCTASRAALLHIGAMFDDVGLTGYPRNAS